MSLCIKKITFFLSLLLFITFCLGCVSSTRGNYFKKSQNYEQAIIEYKIVLAENPGNFRANMGLGDIHFERKEFDRASFYYDKAAQKRPGDPSLKEKLSKIKEIFGRIDALMLEGDGFYKDKLYLDAIIKYKRILEITAVQEEATQKLKDCKTRIDEAALFFSEGASGEREGDYKKAFYNYSKAFDITPYNDHYKKKKDPSKKAVRLPSPDYQ